MTIRPTSVEERSFSPVVDEVTETTPPEEGAPAENSSLQTDLSSRNIHQSLTPTCQELLISEMFDATVFRAAIEAAKNEGREEDISNETFGTRFSRWYGPYVHTYPEEEYTTMRKFLTEDMLGGFALNDGDVISVFKHPKSPHRKLLKSLIPMAIDEGGRRLDCFREALPVMYSQFGFVPVAKMKFDPNFAPPDWNYERDLQPDIVFMVYDSQSPFTAMEPKDQKKQIPLAIQGLPYSSYDEAQIKQKQAQN